MGRPAVHWEFWTEDPNRVSDFYKRVFDWEIRSIPALDYRLVETGGSGGINGGIMKPQAGPLARQAGTQHWCGRSRSLQQENPGKWRKGRRG